MKRSVFLTLLMAFSFLRPLSAQTVEPPWPMFLHDARHTGRTAYLSCDVPVLAWSYYAGSPIDSSPAIGPEGRVFAGSDGGRVYAIDSAGSLAWSYLTEGVVLTSPALGSDGTIYVCSDDYRVYALTGEGALSWTFRTGFLIESQPTLDGEDRVYVGSDDFMIYALNSTGSLGWSYRTGGYVMSSPAVAQDGGIYAGSLDKRMYALTSSGSLAWTHVTGGDVTSSPSVGADGSIYAGSLDNALFALDSSGGLLWSYPAGDAVWSSPAITADGGICAGSSDNNMYALSSAGVLAWSYATGDWVISSPAIDGGGRVHAGSEDGVIYAIDSWGVLDWSYVTGGAVDSSPAIGADGRVFAGSGDGMLYALSDPSPTPTITCTPTPTPTSLKKLALMKREAGGDMNLYCYAGLKERDWTYWDAAARNPSPCARDLWMIPSGNDAAGLAGKVGSGGGELLVLARAGGGDVNLYVYNSPAAGDWTYWDAYARNPSPLARDLWVIPSGNSAVAVASVDITGDGDEELVVLARDGPADLNMYYYNAPAPGDWTYWDAVGRNPSPLARDLWILPSGNDVVGLTSITVDGEREKLAIMGGEGDLNMYLLNNLLPGDWTYWDALARNPSPLARDLWIVPAGNDAVGLAAVNMDGVGPEELAVLKEEGSDINLYSFRSPLPGDWSYWDAFYRNPVALARDFWVIPSGNDTAAMAAVRLR